MERVAPSLEDTGSARPSSRVAPPEQSSSTTPGWRIAPKTALILAAVCWTGFVGILLLVKTGQSTRTDSLVLLFWQGSRPGAAGAGSPFVLETVRDLTALGGVLLRNLIALGAIVALLGL